MVQPDGMSSNRFHFPVLWSLLWVSLNNREKVMTKPLEWSPEWVEYTYSQVSPDICLWWRPGCHAVMFSPHFCTCFICVFAHCGCVWWWRHPLHLQVVECVVGRGSWVHWIVADKLPSGCTPHLWVPGLGSHSPLLLNLSPHC